MKASTRQLSLDGIPSVLRIVNQPRAVSVAEGVLTIVAGPETDLFVDPRGEYLKSNSPRILFVPDEQFQLSSRVAVDLASDYDAGALLLYVSERQWAKFALEYSPQHEPMIVSVVNRGVSDDCNSAVLDASEVYLRISGLGGAFALHYSVDGSLWHLVRYFSLDGDEVPQVGFSAQSPTGQSCSAVFSEISYSQAKLGDLRSGE